MTEREGRWRLFMVGERTLANATPEEVARIAELSDKLEHGLTQAEFGELRALQGLPAGAGVVEVGDLPDMGVEDPRKMRGYLQSLDRRALEAYRRGFYLEAISLTLLALDFMLRGYVLRKTGKPVESERWFSTLIRDAKKAGLSDDVVRCLWDFNNKRTSGIHLCLPEKLGTKICENRT